MSNIIPFPVYPSQLSEFKAIADEISSAISFYTKSKPISAFKRYDLLAIAIGYKGHSDLINASKFRQSSDLNQPLLLLEHPQNISAVIAIFSKRLELDENQISYACLMTLANQIELPDAPLSPDLSPPTIIDKDPTNQFFELMNTLINNVFHKISSMVSVFDPKSIEYVNCAFEKRYALIEYHNGSRRLVREFTDISLLAEVTNSINLMTHVIATKQGNNILEISFLNNTK